ncbi:MAG: hypothetical protein M5U27_07850 [Gaiella sp.]|nr:hypothetical protein [Gaiella sp.]
MSAAELHEIEPSAEETAHRGLVPVPIELLAPDVVRETLAALGRTEDVRLSPSGKRLAIACYAIDRVAVADVALTAAEVRIERIHFLSSPALGEPHGADFIDDETVVVVGRRSGLGVFHLPPSDAPPEAWDTTPVVAIEAREWLEAPGSVLARRVAADRHELLVCVNWAHEVRRYVLEAGRLSPGAIAVRKWLDVPDGVAVSGDGAWTAVSNHYTHSVFVYDSAALGEDAEPVAVLRGATYPHGVRFAADDRRLLVADAGAPYVHVFAADDAWHGVSYPAATIRVMDDETFERARHNPQEGGPKGIDVDARTKLLLVTSESTPLAFFDVAKTVERPRETGCDAAALLRFELQALAAREESTASAKATEAKVREQLAAIEQSLTWRLTEPARGLYRSARRLASRG